MVRTMRNARQALLRYRGVALACATALVFDVLPASVFAAAHDQAAFASPEQAVEALIGAARSESTVDLVKILGPDSKKIVSSGDVVADQQDKTKFLTAYAEAHKLVSEGDDKAILVIGQDEWPFPIPLARQKGAWRFDTKAGQEEILTRRIGGNELSAIAVCAAYFDAQHEYASKDRNHDGFIEYAARLVSSPGKHDGLFWPVQLGEEPSPLGPQMASARAEGYTGSSTEEQRIPYHGYYYRILTGQGKDAPGGAYDYIIKGHMIGGFAMVAFPARYGASGIMTFIVSHDGFVYQRDLGPKTDKIAKAMTRFNPDAGWTRL